VTSPLADLAPRALCPRCRRAQRVCVCAHDPALAPATRVLIVQHPREAGVAVGTASMAARCLPGSTLVVGVALDAHPTVKAALADPERPAILLSPGPDARDLASDPPAGPATLVVVDGTWAQAKKLLKVNPALAALPRYALAPTEPSEYSIRREPSAECLSTIEAVAHALGVLEGDAERFAAMLAPFRAMVAAQVAFARASKTPRFLSWDRRERRAVWTPPEPLRDPARVVLAAIETNAWPFDAKAEHPDELVHVVARRGDGSERFERVVRPAHPLAPGVSVHTDLAGDAILAGAPFDAALRDLRAFVRAGDVVATWGFYGHDWLARLLPETTVLDLRRAAADWRKGAPGAIEAFARGLGPPPDPQAPGRAGRRLALLAQVLAAVRGPRPPRSRPQPSAR
jgi:DTW domain-containing protein YfiP